MNAVGDTSGNKPNLKNEGRMHVYLSGNYLNKIEHVFLIIAMLLIFIAFTN